MCKTGRVDASQSGKRRPALPTSVHLACAFMEYFSTNFDRENFIQEFKISRTVPPFVTVQMFCASRDNRVS